MASALADEHISAYLEKSRRGGHPNSWLIAFSIVKLQMNRPAYRLDLTAQSPVSDFYGDIRAEQVIVGAYNDTEPMLRVDHHYALKVKMLSPLPQRVTLLAVLDAWTQAPREIATQPHLRRLQLRSRLCAKILRIG